MSARGELDRLLTRAGQVLSGHVAQDNDNASQDHCELMASMLREQERSLAELAGNAPVFCEFPQAWPMLARCLLRVVGATQNCDRARAEKWAAVAFALLPMVRQDYGALR